LFTIKNNLCVPTREGIAVRRVSRFFLVVSLAFLPLFPAEARERLVMPFDCGVEGGEVRLSPAAEKSYRIVGGRDEQTVTTCTPAAAAGCTTVMVHRFTISCDGGAVAWMRIAGAIRSAAANRAWIENGRLNLVMSTRGLPEAAVACLEGQANGASGLARRVVLGGDCLPWRRKASFEHLVLPAGFAPVGELGARLMVGAAADEAAINLGDVDAFALEPQLTQVSMTDAEIAVAKADPDALLEPSGRGETFEAALEPDPANDDWITIVHSAPELETTASNAQQTTRTWAWLLVLASAAIVGLLAMRAAPQILAGRSARATSRALAKSDLSLANASVAVSALLQQTETAARALKGAGPLRDVLQGELKQVRARLGNIEKLSSDGEVDAEKSALQYRALVRELERIRRIVDSAVASLSGSKKTATLPRTASEAYEVLGVNAEVSAGVLKKIVDALRMSWHPDHARDADDRVLREDRIRQINIAWDLISANREAA
jgi:hypothetical protein